MSGAIDPLPAEVPAVEDDGLALLAEVEERSGKHQEAMAQYRSILAADSLNVLAMNNLAYLLANEKLDEAFWLAQHALELAPDNPAVQDTMGMVCYRKGLYTKAIEHLKAAVAGDSTPRRQFHLAVSYLKAGDKMAGEQMLAAALKPLELLRNAELPDRRPLTLFSAIAADPFGAG